MMTRVLSPIVLFLTLVVLQTSFFASLPGALAYTPFAFSAGVYLVQHGGQRLGAVAVAGIGLWVAALGISTFPGEWVAAIAGGVTAHVSARNVFSNRSWYGLIACGCLALTTQAVVQSALLGLTQLRHPEAVSWPSFFHAFATTFVLNILLLTIFFAAARPIRKFLRATFLISRDHSS